MTANKKTVGNIGEVLAVEYLEMSGFKILETNAVYGGAETDVIASKKGVTVFVEVKTRSNAQFGLPCEAVTRKKQQRYFNAAKAYAVQHKVKLEDIRFDVVEVLDGTINHIENAFGE